MNLESLSSKILNISAAVHSTIVKLIGPIKPVFGIIIHERASAGKVLLTNSYPKYKTSETPKIDNIFIYRDDD
jgi:hypothetical protein